MGKTHRGHKEFSREQELKYENQKLRREISSLRKQLARVDLDRHAYVREIVEEHLTQEETEETAQQMLHRLKEEWRCKICREGFLEIFVYSKMGEPWYFRKCNGLHCNHRTKSQKYDPNTVRGIVKNYPEKLK